MALPAAAEWAKVTQFHYAYHPHYSTTDPLVCHMSAMPCSTPLIVQLVSRTTTIHDTIMLTLHIYHLRFRIWNLYCLHLSVVQEWSQCIFCESSSWEQVSAKAIDRDWSSLDCECLAVTPHGRTAHGRTGKRQKAAALGVPLISKHCITATTYSSLGPLQTVILLRPNYSSITLSNHITAPTE